MTGPVHVCLVSDQPLPNLTPALDPHFGAARIVLLESPHMQARANAIEHVLRGFGRTVTRRSIDDRGDLLAFRRAIETLLVEFPDALLNATGGLKTMSILAFDAFRAAGQPVFYVERDNRLLWLNPPERPGQRLTGTLRLEDYFIAFGQTLSKANRQPDSQDGGNAWLNKLKYLPAPGHGDHHHVGTRFESLIFRACQQAADLHAGGPAIDLAWGVKTAGTIPDEFDVVLVRDNVLHLIECKHSNGANLNGFLNKLDNLRRKRGITARAALITTARIPTGGGHAQRARESGILLLGQDSLHNMPSRLADWMAGILSP